jgi:hypothetical protein
MTAQPLQTPRFIRKTQLTQGEYRKNFQQIDREIIDAVTSTDADRVTPLMSKIYLRLINAPASYWEREGVLRFEAEMRETGLSIKAWAALCELLGVASATASKALSWMHDVGIIGYFAGKNGVGIRIFLNRAASSIGTRQGSGGKKILEFPPASPGGARASRNEAAFNDSYAVREVLDLDFNSHAPENGAETKIVDKTSPEPATQKPLDRELREREVEIPERNVGGGLFIDEVVRRLRFELEPSLQHAARQAAKQEHERTREWLENKGLPKAARVAQREAYNVLKNHGVIGAAAERARADLEVGRNNFRAKAKPLTEGEIKELAGVCIAMLETHGQAIDATLAEISSEAGGCLLPEDAPKVRDLAASMIQGSNS